MGDKEKQRSRKSKHRKKEEMEKVKIRNEQKKRGSLKIQQKKHYGVIFASVPTP